MADVVQQFDNMVGHIVSINDERDVIPLLLGLKEMWPQVRGEIERLKALSQNNAHSWDAIVRERDELRAENERLQHRLREAKDGRA
jgi:hypothetical protein